MPFIIAAQVRAVNDHDALIQRIVDRRIAFLRALKTWPDFGRGWTRRVRDVLAVGAALDRRSPTYPTATQRFVSRMHKRLPRLRPATPLRAAWRATNFRGWACF
jgi:lysozyme family protein